VIPAYRLLDTAWKSGTKRFTGHLSREGGKHVARTIPSVNRKSVEVFEGACLWGLRVGLEPKDTFLDGVRTLTGMGANVVPFVWSPNPGSRLAGHRAPPEVYAEVIREARVWYWTAAYIGNGEPLLSLRRQQSPARCAP